MSRRIRVAASCGPALVLLLPVGVLAAEETKKPAPQSLEQVVITGTRDNDSNARRYATAAKMVFGRDELSRYGDSTVADVLKRLPGVTVAGTPGRGGDIRMRGLGNGYTLILLNGEPAPRGFSLDSLTPDQIERIEVMRAPVAEFSTRAVAGTINIVLREKFVKKDNEARISLGSENGKLQPSAHLGKSDGDKNFDYNFHLSPARRDQKSESVTDTRAVDPTTGATTLAQHQSDESRSICDNVHLSGRLNWKFGGGDSLGLNPFLMQARTDTTSRSHIDASVGTAPYADAESHSHANSAQGRIMGNWRLALAEGSKLDLRFNAGLADSDSTTSRWQYDSTGTLTHTASSDASVRDATLSLGGKYSRPLGQGHNLAYGLELERGSRRETGNTIQDGIAQLAAFGSTVDATSRRLATYAQDEWDISPLWSIYGGLRWESIRTDSRWASGSAANDSSVLSPLFHSVWRFTEESRDQIRLGLTRSYKAPTLPQLLPKPTLAAAYPTTGPNIATSPDSTGNPSLKPELAWGLDLAYEHYLSAGGILSVSVFERSIDDLVRNVTSLQSVSWSPVQRWVTTPQNVGRATTAGIELEAKFRLAELVDNAPPLDLRANFSRFVSRVSDIPGPDNRLDQQPRMTANLGADYRLRSLPLTVGGNFNWTPDFSIRQSDAQYYSQGSKRIVDVYGLWKFDANTQLRVTAANVLHADYVTATRYADTTTDQSAQTTARTYRVLTARLEVKF